MRGYLAGPPSGVCEMPQAASNKAKTMTSVRAVDRAIAVLQAFSADTPSMSVIELQHKVGLSRPTLYRLLETLAYHGLIRVHGTPQKFSLDYGVGQLAQNWLKGIDLAAAAQPILKRLNEDTKETIGLNIRRGHRYVCVLELPGSHALSMSRGIGPRDQLVRGAGGKAILAFMPEKDIEAMVRTAPKDINRKTLLEDLVAARRVRFSVTRGEIFVGAVGIAAPYFDHTDQVVGCIIVTGPEARFSEDQITRTARRVVESAAELSAALGHATSRQTFLKSRPLSALASKRRSAFSS
jgi:DNA-binding IclR family transcriptional regulator